MSEDWRNEVNEKSQGGTEMMMSRLYDTFDSDLLSKFQIIPSRVRELNESKIRILYCHDLPEDPESHHLKNEGWRKFHKIVFVSNWQQQAYINHYNIPWSRTCVIRNSTTPMEVDIEKKFTNPETINVVYHTTPHRGLELLVPAFEKAAEVHPELRLHVYSSFEIYGWKDRNKPYEPLFERIKDHPQMTYYGTVPNEEIKRVLPTMHIFAYPSVWLETSCISLMEAMSAGCVCIHPNLGALYETAAGWTMMYNWNEDHNAHAELHSNLIHQVTDLIKNNSSGMLITKLNSQKSYTDLFYNWEVRKHDWENLLETLKDSDTKIETVQKPMFTYMPGR